MEYSIFMSYSRKDEDKAEKIINALKNHRVVTWVDKQDVPKGEIIESTLFQGIEKSTVFLFLISPDSVESEWCQKEIKHATKNAKRILPVYIQATDANRIPKSITDRNYIYCRDGQDNFEDSVQLIYKTIRTDYEWANYHTNLQNKMLAWNRHEKRTSWLLHGDEIKDAEKRINLATQKNLEPLVTKEQNVFVQASRKFEQKKQRILIASIAIAFSLICALLIISIVTRQSSNQQTLLEQSRKIAIRSIETKDENQGLSLLLAYEAYKRSPTFEAKKAILQSAKTIDPKMRMLLRNQGTATTFSVDGKVLAIGGLDGKIYFLNTDRLEFIDKPIITQQSVIREIAYSTDGKKIVALDADGKIFIWDIKAKKEFKKPVGEIQRKIIGFAFIPSHDWLVLARERLDNHGDVEIILWDIQKNEYVSNALEINCTRCEKIAATLNEKGQITIAYGAQPIYFDKETKAFVGYSRKSGLPSAIEISPDGKYILYGQNDESSGFRTGTYSLGKVLLYDVQTKNTLEIYGSQARRINDMEISRDGTTLVIGGGGNDGYSFVTVLSNSYGEYSENWLRGYSSEVISVSIHPDKNLVAASDLSGNVIIWDLTNKIWRGLVEIGLEWELGDSEDYDTVIFSKDSKFVTAITRPNRQYTWDLSTGFKSHQNPSSQLLDDNLDNVSEAISPYGDLKAIAGESTILVDNFTGQELMRLGRAGFVKFSPDGKYLITYGFPSHAYFPHPPAAWNVSIDTWFNKICEIVKGNLSPDEWADYIGDRKYQSTCPTK